MQILLLLAGVGGLVLMPPARGQMLIVPLASSDSGLPVRIAVARGAALVARGPLPGSVLVDGDLGRLRAGFPWGTVLIVAAPPGGCGAPA